MDAKKLIEAAEYCAIEAHETCSSCPMCEDCPADERDPVDIAIRLITVRDHVRAEVISQAKEYWLNAVYEISRGEHPTRAFDYWFNKLDELAGEERNG